MPTEFASNLYPFLGQRSRSLNTRLRSFNSFDGTNYLAENHSNYLKYESNSDRVLLLRKNSAGSLVDAVDHNQNSNHNPTLQFENLNSEAPSRVSINLQHSKGI